MLIYLVTNTVNRKIYIGKWQGKSWTQRWAIHVANARSFASGKRHHFHAAIRKYKPESFIVTEIARATNPKELCDLEKFYIAKYRSHDPRIGYNQTLGGEGEAWTEERRKRASAERRARQRKMSQEQKDHLRTLRIGERNPFFGKTHTVENRKKMATRLGQKNTPEQNAKISAAVSGEKNGMFGKSSWTGRHHTKATKKKLSETRREMYAANPALAESVSEVAKRNWQNPKTKKKMLAGLRKGSKMSSMTQFGHHVSEETKRKISEAAKARHAARRQADHDRKDVRNGGPMMVVPQMYPHATF